jgi:hypothetical protein
MVFAALLACMPRAQVRDLEVSNQTTLSVTLVVNGTAMRTLAPGVKGAVRTSELPALPWMVEARSPSGRVLASLTVRAGDVRETTTPGGGREYRGAGVRVNLSCGRLGGQAALKPR